MQFDIIVLGGSYAGMSAALQIARARRNVLVIDAGVRRNRFAETSHGFLGQDGRAPDLIVHDARAQLLAYPNVTWIEDKATDAAGQINAFSVMTSNNGHYGSKRLVLATGVVDKLANITGLRERWGRSVFHCPYCHGYETNNGQLGVLATSPLSFHQSMMLPDWGDTTLFTNDVFNPDADQLAALSERGVAIERGLVTAISGEGKSVTVNMADGRLIDLAGLFTMSQTEVASPIAKQLGCAFEDGPMGEFIKTDTTKATTVGGVYACGDAAIMAGSISLAVGDGTRAGVSAHQSLIFGHMPR